MGGLSASSLRMATDATAVGMEDGVLRKAVGLVDDATVHRTAEIAGNGIEYFRALERLDVVAVLVEHVIATVVYVSGHEDFARV
jgi:hypothetical protein